MGTGEALLSDMQNVVIMPVVALNMMVLLFLIDHASESYLQTLKKKAKAANQAIETGQNSQTGHGAIAAKTKSVKPDVDLNMELEFEHARLRLEIFWTFALIAATAAALKMTLPADLADKIIAAWFVGQGFALQPYVQSFISGIAVRNNADVWKTIMNGGTLQIEGDKYMRFTHNVFNLTMISSELSEPSKYRILQWQNIAQFTIAGKAA